MQPPQEVAPSTYALGTDWVNWYLVGEGNDLVVVDGGLPAAARSLASDLALLGLREEQLKGVVLTHSDGDHTGLAPYLCRRGLPVYVHAQDRATLERPRPKRGDGKPAALLPLLLKPAFWRLSAALLRGGGFPPKGCAGATSIEREEPLPLPGSPLALHTPGHTAGHCVVYFPRQRLLFVGDLFCTRNPLGGKEGLQPLPRPLNEDTALTLRSLERIEGLAADLVLPGHGPPFQGSPAEAVAEVRKVAAKEGLL